MSTDTIAWGTPSSHSTTHRAKSGPDWGVSLATVRSSDCTPYPAMYGFAPGLGVMSLFAVAI